jgi:hypothetical protein
MWSFIAQAVLFVGLVSLVGVSGGMLAFDAVRHYLAERTEPAVAAESATTAEYRKAA